MDPTWDIFSSLNLDVAFFFLIRKGTNKYDCLPNTHPNFEQLPVILKIFFKIHSRLWEKEKKKIQWDSETLSPKESREARFRKIPKVIFNGPKNL